MGNRWNRREFMLGAAALATAVGIESGAIAAPDMSALRDGNGLAGDAEGNKALLKKQREAAQLRALPSAIPGEEGNFTPWPMGSERPLRSMHSNDSPITPDMSDADRARIQGGFASHALGPTFLSFGPMLAEGKYVVEEWESQIYGGNGTLYNNQYITVRELEGGKVTLSHQYNDSHHASLIFGPPGKWPAIKPPTGPRRRNHDGHTPPAFAPDEIETVFEVSDRFELDPRMLTSVVPADSASPLSAKPGIAANRALVQGLRRARAAGDQAQVNRFYGPGFRHFMAGEWPLGWSPLPMEELYAPLVKHLASPITVIYGPMVADDTRVFEQMDIFARLDDGTVYNNWHAFVHEIRDGKIVQTREYLDTLHLWVVLGRWAEWGKVPVPPRSSPRRSNLQGIAATIQYPTTFGPDLERWRPFDPIT